MAHDSEDRLVNVGDSWVWLSDISAISPANTHNWGGLDLLRKPEGSKSAVLIVGQVIYDPRDPQTLALEVMGNGN